VLAEKVLGMARNASEGKLPVALGPIIPMSRLVTLVVMIADNTTLVIEPVNCD
jgi:hypothetical protein